MLWKSDRVHLLDIVSIIYKCIFRHTVYVLIVVLFQILSVGDRLVSVDVIVQGLQWRHGGWWVVG